MVSPMGRAGETKGGMVHVDAYDQQRRGHSVDVREHYRSRPGSGGMPEGGFPREYFTPIAGWTYKSRNLGFSRGEWLLPPHLKPLVDYLNALDERDRRQALVREALTTGRARLQRVDTDVIPAPKGRGQSPNPQPGYLTDDGEPIDKPVGASEYVKENAATNKLPSQMQPSDALVDALKRNEGTHIDKETGLHKEYLDSADRRTIGYGHLLAENESYPNGITEEQAKALLRQDLQKAKNNVDRAVKVPIPQQTYDSLISLSYNVGSISGSKLVEKMNRGDFDGASLEFRDWNKITQKMNGRDVKVPVKGLTARRSKEEKLFKGGGYGSN